MKKIIAFIMSMVILFPLAACSNNKQAETPSLSFDDSTKVLVVYYSASGNTKAVAQAIADTANAEQFELIPETPYTDDDLNWRDRNSQVSREYDNESLREVPLEKSAVDNWDDYDVVFIGYPIWWGIAAWPVDTFIKSNDFTGKTVIPFCTATSSDIGQSGELLAAMAGTGEWVDGIRFREHPDSADVTEWVKELGLAKQR